MKKSEIIGRMFEILFLLASLSILSYGFNISKLNIFSFASLIFLIGGAIFESAIRRIIKPRSNTKKGAVFLNALLYLHFMPKFQKEYGDLYDFKNTNELKSNILTYLIVFIYILVVYSLLPYVGRLSLLIYLIPAFTNIFSLLKVNKK